MSTAITGSQDRPAVDVALLVVRVIVGIIFVAHGAQKLFGVFGGPGLTAMVQPPPNGMGLLGYPVTIGEFFGGLGLIVGFLSRFSAASLIVIMFGAIGRRSRKVCHRALLAPAKNGRDGKHRSKLGSSDEQARETPLLMATFNYWITLGDCPSLRWRYRLPI